MALNPYSDTTFFSFFAVLMHRFFEFITGGLNVNSAVCDEVQIGVLAAVAISGGIVGTFLVLRRMTMLANGLAHTILLGIVSVYFLSIFLQGATDFYRSLTIPLLTSAALVSGLFTTFFTEFLNKTFKLQEDASIGIVFTFLFALGITLITLFSRNIHIGLELVMGNVDALTKEEFSFVFFTMLFNIFLIVFLFNGFKVTTFDPVVARSYGFSSRLFNYLLMVQASITTIGGFRAVGVVMILAFLVIPPLTARLLTNRLSHMLFLASLIGVLGSVMGVAFSRHILTVYGVGLSTGGITVTLLGIFYLLAAMYRKINTSISFRKRAYS